MYIIFKKALFVGPLEIFYLHHPVSIKKYQMPSCIFLWYFIDNKYTIYYHRIRKKGFTGLFYKVNSNPYWNRQAKRNCQKRSVFASYN